MVMPEFLQRFRPPSPTRPDDPVGEPSRDDLPPWPSQLRPWWDEATDSPTEAELITFVKWAETAARGLARTVHEIEGKSASKEFERRCAVFDKLPGKVKKAAIEADRKPRCSPEAKREAELRRRFLLVWQEYARTEHEPYKRFDQLPDFYNWVYTVHDEDAGRWIARRWAQPKPVGEGEDEVEAVLDLRRKETE